MKQTRAPLETRVLRRAAFLFFLSLQVLSGTSFAAGRQDVWATTPLLALMVRFLGGIHISVHALSHYDDHGRLVRVKTKIPSETCVVALDKTEAVEFGLSEEYRSVLLFERMPFLRKESDAFFLDPATMPALGQRVLISLSTFDAANYLYYQRRLAEFQSRLESTVGVGRQLLGETAILDLTSIFYLWMDAAAQRHIRPPTDLITLWQKEASLDVLEKTLAEAEKGGWIILYDPLTPTVVKERLLRSPNALLLALPDVDRVEDLFLFLYDQYLAVWNFSRQRTTGTR
jgi:hypothetical protein